MNNTFLIICFVCLSCMRTCDRLKALDQNLQAVEVRSTGSGSAPSLYRIYHYGPLTMFDFWYWLDSFADHTRKDSTSSVALASLRPKTTEWRNRYFIFHKDSSYGYSYDAYNFFENNRRRKVDATLKTIKVRYDHDFSIKPDSVFWSRNKDSLREVYKLPETRNFAEGTLALYFLKNMIHLQESLNKELDSAKGMKFYKYEIRYEPFTDSDNKTWPAGIDVIEMKEIDADTSEVMPVFRKYWEGIQSRRKN